MNNTGRVSPQPQFFSRFGRKSSSVTVAVTPSPFHRIYFGSGV